MQREVRAPVEAASTEKQGEEETQKSLKTEERKDAMKNIQQFANIKQLCKTRKVAVGSSQESALYPISVLLNGEKLGRGPTLLLIF